MIMPSFAVGIDPLHRARVLVPLAHVEGVRRAFGVNGQKALIADIEKRVAALIPRWRSIVTMQDPSDHRIMNVIGRAPEILPVGRTTDGIVRIASVGPLDEPPSRAPPVRSDLDPGLTSEEIDLVLYVLANEKHPGHLRGLAGTFEPQFPIAASRLRAQVVRVERMRPGYRPRASHAPLPRARAPIPVLRAALVAYAAREGILLDVIETEARRVACIYAEDPPLAREILARFPAPIHDLGAAVVRLIDPEIRIVDPALARLAFPPNGREGIVPPAALQLALAAAKPQAARVADPARSRAIVKRFEEDMRAADQDPDKGMRLMQARGSMEAAQRCLERRRAVEYYRSRRTR